MNILAINAGSSSVKFATFAAGSSAPDAFGAASADPHSAQIQIKFHHGADLHAITAGTKDAAESLPTAVIRALAESRCVFTDRIKSIDAIGQRVVHGGTRFSKSIRVDAAVKAEIARLVELAPLHNSLAVDAIAAVEKSFPGVPQVAVFDTAFFATLPPAAHVYALPYEWYETMGIRRFGFHGLSHSYCAGHAAKMLGRKQEELRLVICHLGSGCSASAIKNGAPLATTMGFTPLEGIVMGTRPGNIDPGIIPYLQRHKNLSFEQIDDILNHRSGIFGISGVSSDYREVEHAAAQGNQRAQLALDIFANSIRATIGAFAVTLGGLDALVFTGGIGEHSAPLRARVCEGLQCLGIALDSPKNSAVAGDADISAAASTVKTIVMETREELVIAQETERTV